MKWVSVEDRLPECHTKVVVFCLGNTSFAYYDGFVFRHWNTGICFAKGDVDYWIDLLLIPRS